ncbi:MAG: LysM peptidoglycan-binding domain-containing protein [Clostridia bacterium]|nr:LysM peptidoglycan-binding domain-containing protein [Clostridia bacterium]
MYGYTSYVIKPGDTLYSIAIKFSSTVNRILMANPNIKPNSLKVGTSIIVPFSSVVQTNISYTYDILKMNISSFSVLYPFLEIGSIGNSVMGKDIPYIRIGTGRKEVFYSSAIHANEWITSPVIMKFIENLALAYVGDGYIYRISCKKYIKLCFYLYCSYG